ncbi:hypothetical protein [Campylobacter pinnipediorum]|uniref:Uncharacterized protein n=1 Tax=Campylobacter pinnipediorum subsp. pinnipediorum TaxID=1660067 RepID=A0AAX0L976_9BACT|nr:hypothetical protein [Campylobacter pinnipediorum]AQW81272.1 hypothetical protein CPIN17260_0976 [Campylobacter pinnipediorum subsp. pinnipediorum]AQW82896.1 hypothetical protein CPIN17261_0886 [Campylobacter pinnipediorum subsp. pinnipediorum]OPA77238.1 hypothetical protein BFG04_03845 [Campylobacter pinnipediorum subsp. pinnipediorum]
MDDIVVAFANLFGWVMMIIFIILVYIAAEWMVATYAWVWIIPLAILYFIFKKRKANSNLD